MRRLEALILLLFGGALASSAAWSAHRVPDTLPKQKVQDLHYGDVLFRFYSGDTWGALTSLEAYEHWQRMPHNEQDAQLLAGSLYLTLGMHNEAGRRFAGLARVPPAARLVWQRPSSGSAW